VFDTYAVSRYPGTKANLDTSCEDYVHSSSSTLAAKPRRRKAAKAGGNTTETSPQQQQNLQQQGTNPDKNQTGVPNPASSPAPLANSTAPAGLQPVLQQVTNTTSGLTNQSTAGAEMPRTATTDATASSNSPRRLLESYSYPPRDDRVHDVNDNDDGDVDGDYGDDETGLDSVMAGVRRRYGRSGYFGGRAIIITGYITSITGAPQAHVFRGGLVEHVSRFSQALPLTKAEYGMLPTDVPEVVPGSYKYLLYKRL
jgi:hypothetical protein